MRIEDILAPELVLPVLQATTKAGILAELAGTVADHHPEVDRARLLAALEEREKLNSTAIGDGVAIPHGKIAGIKRVFAAFGRCPAGVDFDAIDEQPTHLFFLLVAPEESAGAHLKALARISRLLKNAEFRAQLLAAADAEAVYAAIRDEDAKY